MKDAASILVIDDYAGMRRLIRNMLRPVPGLDLDEDDGQRALDKLRDKRYHLVLCDVLMEPVNGLELLRAIRADRLITQPPVIMVTAMSDAAFVMEAKAAGADDYVVKPFSAAALRRKVENALAKTADRPRPVASPEPATDELTKLRLALDSLLDVIAARLAAGDRSRQTDLLRQIDGYLKRAVSLGLDAAAEQHLGRRLAALVAQFRTGPQPTPVADRRAADTAEPLGRRSGQERRRHARFAAPALTVTADGAACRTRNWSLGGLALIGFRGQAAMGQPLAVAVAVPNGQPCADTASPLRCDFGDGLLALQLARPTCALEALEQHMVG